MHIDIVFDTVCPWCFIGKRRLEEAVRQSSGAAIETKWHSFLLNPDMPQNGIDKETYFDAKFGGDHRSQRIYGAIGDAGRSVAIDFDFDKVHRVPNTVNSHRLVKYSSRHGPADLAGAAVEALFQAYFIDGKDIGNHSVLIEIGRHLGLAEDDLRQYLHRDEDAELVRDENAQAHRMGVTGVPAYIIDGQFAVSGAQDPQIFLRMFDIARAKRFEELEATTQSLEQSEGPSA